MGLGPRWEYTPKEGYLKLSVLGFLARDCVVVEEAVEDSQRSQNKTLMVGCVRK